jgi:hypothetical protein
MKKEIIALFALLVILVSGCSSEAGKNPNPYLEDPSYCKDYLDCEVRINENCQHICNGAECSRPDAMTCRVVNKYYPLGNEINCPKSSACTLPEKIECIDNYCLAIN